MSFRPMLVTFAHDPEGFPGRLILAQSGKDFMVGALPHDDDCTSVPPGGAWWFSFDDRIGAKIGTIFFDNDEIWQERFRVPPAGPTQAQPR